MHVARVIRLSAALTVLLAFATTGLPAGATKPALSKFDQALQQRAASASGHTRIIIRLAPAASRAAATRLLEQLGGTAGRALPIINGQAASLPNAALAALAASPLVEHVSLDRVVAGSVERTGAATGAAPVRESLGVDGTGVGVAVIDSGIARWHDDLTGASNQGQRVDRFVDFLQRRTAAYDDYGHGTHVAGIVAGNGFDSGGARTGIAPGARLTILKVLDDAGSGRVSDVIAAMDYILANRDALNIRVVNLSLSAPVFEPYDTDPLTLAARRLVSAGVVVVVAAGNHGRGAAGEPLYGSVGAPGNAPWVLTVGASSHQGTADRSDDSIAAFSSRGPAAGGWAAKPDLVAPGMGIESLSDPDSALYELRAAFLLGGTVATTYLPYLSLSGTSMSAPVVSGTVALMLQANPALTPNQVKAILQYTAEVHPAYNTFEQGAGFLNAKGAVELAHYFVDPSTRSIPSEEQWSRRIIWGNQMVKGGRLRADANAWSPSVTWGAAEAPDGETIAWGVADGTEPSPDGSVAERPWTVAEGTENVVWGALCGGADCGTAWDNRVVLGTDTGDTVVWGMNDWDTVVWGMNDETVVWGMGCSITECEPVIWGKQ